MARAELRVRISAEARAFNRVLGRVKATAFQAARTIGLIGVGIGAFSVKRMSDFEKQMAEVNTIARLGKQDFENLKKEVMALSAEFGQSKEALTKGLYDALSAGIPAENGVEFLTKATKLAIAGVTDTSTAVDLLTSVLNAFGMGGAKAVDNLDKVLDTLFKTVELGKTTIPELAEAVGKVAPQANLAGASMDETAGALAALTLSGLNTAEATTRLTRLFESFTTPTTKMKEVITDLGFASGQAMVQEIGFAEAVRRTIGPLSKDAEAINAVVTTKRAFAAAAILAARDGEDFTRVLAGMGEKAGSAERAFQTMAGTTAFQMAQLQQVFDNIAITIGTALVDPLKDVATELKTFAENEKNIEAVAAAFRTVGLAIVSVVTAMNELFKLGGRINDAVITPATEGLARLAKKLGIVTENASKLAQTEKALSPEEVETGVLKPGAAINAPEVLNTVLTKVRDALFMPLKFAAEFPTMLDILREIRDHMPGIPPGSGAASP